MGKTINPKSEDQSEPCVLIEGPKYGDAEFYGIWLLKAAEVEAHWKAIQDCERVMALCYADIPDFGIAATALISRLQKNSCVIRVSREDMREWVDLLEFAIMAELGFYTVTGSRYQVTIPTHLDFDKVKAAVLKLAETEDEHFMAYPERFVTTMPRTEAQAWQQRLSDMNEDHRCSDRALLLGA
jgi:hypothetical protein